MKDLQEPEGRKKEEKEMEDGRKESHTNIDQKREKERKKGRKKI